jgi:hypothetical protein
VCQREKKNGQSQQDHYHVPERKKKHARKKKQADRASKIITMPKKEKASMPEIKNKQKEPAISF